MILVYAGSIALIIISAIHLYWFFGGSWGEGSVTPNDKEGNPLVPSKPVIMLSALMFLVAALLPLAATGVINLPITYEVYVALLSLGLLSFTVRGVLGFILSARTPKPRTSFNTLNMRLYTPIIVLLGASYLAAILLLV
jgi:hypothetical protein